MAICLVRSLSGCVNDAYGSRTLCVVAVSWASTDAPRIVLRVHFLEHDYVQTARQLGGRPKYPPCRNVYRYVERRRVSRRQERPAFCTLASDAALWAAVHSVGRSKGLSRACSSRLRAVRSACYVACR